MPNEPIQSASDFREATDIVTEPPVKNRGSQAPSPRLTSLQESPKPSQDTLREKLETTSLPDPHGHMGVPWQDYKVTMQYSRQFKAWEIKFNEGRPEDRPNDAILEFIKKEVGLHWNRHNKAWGLVVDPTNPTETYDIVRSAFDKVVEMLTEEKGPPGYTKKPAKAIG